VRPETATAPTDPSAASSKKLHRGDSLHGLLDVGDESLALAVLLHLQHALYILVPLQQPLAVEVPLLDVLLPPRLDALQQRLQLVLLLAAKLALQSGEDDGLTLFHLLLLFLFGFVSDALEFLSIGVLLPAVERQGDCCEERNREGARGGADRARMCCRLRHSNNSFDHFGGLEANSARSCF
jgi:hypothetical protein